MKPPSEKLEDRVASLEAQTAALSTALLAAATALTRGPDAESVRETLLWCLEKGAEAMLASDPENPSMRETHAAILAIHKELRTIFG